MRQARSNAGFLAQFDLTTTQHPDWAITVAFYAAVHLVEAVFARRGLDSQGHHDRNQEVAQQLPSVAAHYMRLYSESRAVRYECVRVTPVSLQTAIRVNYESVRAHVCQLLGLAL